MNDKSQDPRQTAQDQGQIDHSVAVPVPVNSVNTVSSDPDNNIADLSFLQPSQVDMTPFAISTSVNNPPPPVPSPQHVTVAPFATSTANQAVPGILSDQHQGSDPGANLPQLPSMHPTAAASPREEMGGNNIHTHPDLLQDPNLPTSQMTNPYGAAGTMPVSNQTPPGLQGYYHQAQFTPSPSENSNVYCYSPQHPGVDYREYRPTPIHTPSSTPMNMAAARTTILPPATLLPASQPGMAPFQKSAPPAHQVSFNMTKDEYFAGLAHALTMAMKAAPAPAPAAAPIDDEIMIIPENAIKKEPEDEPQNEQTQKVNGSDEDFSIPKDGEFTAAKLEQELQSIAQANASATTRPQSSRSGKIAAPVKPSPVIEKVKTHSNIKHLL